MKRKQGDEDASANRSEATDKSVPLVPQPGASHRALDVFALERMFYDAALHAQYAHARQLVRECGVDPNCRVEEYGRTLLYCAIAENNLRLAEFLLLELDGRYDVNAKTPFANTQTPLHAAIRANCDVQFIDLLLACNCSVNAKDYLRQTVLHCALYLERPLQIVERIMARSEHIDIDATDHYRSTALHYAARASNDKYAQVIPWFLDRQANTSVFDNAQYTPLHCAIMRNNVQVVKAFLARDSLVCDINIASGSELRTALHLSTLNRSSKITRMLLQSGAEVSARDVHGNSALHIAAQNHDLEHVRILVDDGNADINAPNDRKATPLHKCVESRVRFHTQQQQNDEAVLEFLLERGANVHVKNSDGETPLFVCAQHGTPCAIEILINYGARNQVNCMGWTPLHAAVMKSNCDISSVLLSRNPEIIHAVDNDECSALHLCMMNAMLPPSIHLIKMLVVRGISMCNKNARGDTPLSMILACQEPDWRAARDFVSAAYASRSLIPLLCVLTRGEEDENDHLVRKYLHIDLVRVLHGYLI